MTAHILLSFTAGVPSLAILIRLKMPKNCEAKLAKNKYPRYECMIFFIVFIIQLN